MGYYRAGDYYRAGGFFKHLAGAVKSIVKGPVGGILGTTVAGFIPGGATALAVAKTAREMIVTKSAPAAVAASTAGTPGHMAFSRFRGRARRALSRRRRPRSR